jgi:hypothetical protein
MKPTKEIRPPSQRAYIYLFYCTALAILISVGFVLASKNPQTYYNSYLFVTHLVICLASVVGFVVWDFVSETKRERKYKETFIKILRNINIADHETLIKDEQVDGIRSIYNIEMKPDYKKNEYYLIIHTLRPGILIGLRGTNIKKLQKFLAYDFGYEPRIEFEEPTIFKNIYSR